MAERLCEWWAQCDRAAVTTLPHPVLGAVPICALCKTKVEQLTDESTPLDQIQDT
jgi:hypothetical protein